MITLKQFIAGLDAVPGTTSWYLADISETKGRQELFKRQLPQRLKALKEHTLIESAVSSNRIEGVEVDKKRIGTIIFGKSLLHDRPEEEVRGYRDALKRFQGDFSVADMRRECPGVGIDMIRKTLKDLQAQGIVECLGRGRSAKWRKTGNQVITD